MEQKKEITEILSTLGENDRKDLIKKIIEGAVGNKEKRNNNSPEVTIEKLTQLKQSLDKVHDFKVGDIVKWKQNLKNKSIPEYDEPAIVLALLDEPLMDSTKEAGSIYFREPLDIVLGVLSNDEMMCYHYDKRKFEPYS